MQIWGQKSILCNKAMFQLGFSFSFKVQENYHDPNLTMNELAERLQINPVMLSMEFRNEMDIRPSDYLGNLRMEKAKKLLGTTNMLIREISIAVGYEDEHVFRRRFKNTQE